MWLSSNRKPRLKRISQGRAPGTRRFRPATLTPSTDTGARAQAKPNQGVSLEDKVTQVDTGNHSTDCASRCVDLIGAAPCFHSRIRQNSTDCSYPTFELGLILVHVPSSQRGQWAPRELDWPCAPRTKKGINGPATEFFLPEPRQNKGSAWPESRGTGQWRKLPCREWFLWSRWNDSPAWTGSKWRCNIFYYIYTALSSILMNEKKTVWGLAVASQNSNWQQKHWQTWISPQ